MNFRPCIDIHNGKVKQIVGGSLSDKNDRAQENFVSEQSAAYYAEMYRYNHLKGGHIILLNPKSSDYYEATKRQALEALKAYPMGLQVGGGITDENAEEYLDAGAAHVIVTSFVFQNGLINVDNLHRILSRTGKDRLVLDLSCRKKGDDYYIVTDRWQNFTNIRVSLETLHKLAGFCDEFLIHGVDVEGKAAGIDHKLVSLLSGFDEIPVTYAGGIGKFEDLVLLKELGCDRLDVTIGSSLDIFGGTLPFEKVVEFFKLH